MIQWQSFPKSDAATPLAVSVVAAFQAVADEIDSSRHDLKSNPVLALVAPHLVDAGFDVETGKRATERISIPVLFGLNGQLDKYFDADAYHKAGGFVVEVEAGRGVVNHQFLKDLFEACMMRDVFHLCIAVRNRYKGRGDFEAVFRFFETLYASQRLQLPLTSVLIIGY